MPDKMVAEVLRKMQKECKNLTSLRFNSKLRQTTVRALKEFKWEDVLEEWRETAPTFNRFLESASNPPKEGKKPLKPRALAHRHSKKCTMAMAGATLLRARCHTMTAPLYLNALVMRHGGAKKRCFERLVKVGVCVSSDSALQKVKDIAKTWDSKVLKWKEDVCKSKAPAQPLPGPADDMDTIAPEESLPMQITIDNLDRSVTPHTMTKKKQKRDNHWMIMLANRERVSAAHLTEHNQRFVQDVPISEIIPNKDDKQHMKEEFAELIGRVLVSQLPALSQFKDNIKSHIPHRYSSTMAKKTETIPLGLLDAEEMKSADMIKTMRYLNNKYVPYIDEEVRGETVLMPAEKVIVTGDQLTKQNCDSALSAMGIGRKGAYDKAKGIVPAIADFHCSMNTNDVIFKKYYSTASNSEKGTLFQLRNHINRRNVSTSAIGDKYTASNNFIQDVTDATIIAAALHYFGMDNIHDTPKKTPIPAMFSSDEQKQHWIDTHLGNIVETYVLTDRFEIGDPDTDEVWKAHADTLQTSSLTCRFKGCEGLKFRTHGRLKKHVVDTHNVQITHHGEPKRKSEDLENTSDGVFNYHSGFLKVALLERDFQDSIKEGDGQRTCRLWKFKMLHFKQAGRTKYSLEALKLRLDIAAVQSPSVAHRLVWNRTVNVSGIAGHNIALDLNCEHYVKYTKEVMDRLGANLEFGIAQELSRSIGEMKTIMDRFDEDCGVSPRSGRHTEASKQSDIMAMVEVLHENDVFSFQPGRLYSSFRKQSVATANPLDKMNTAQIVEWILENKEKCHLKQIYEREIAIEIDR